MTESNKIYRYHPALTSSHQGTLPILANLPHSGLVIPESMREKLKPEYRDFLPNQDWHLEHLYDFLPDLGIATLQATHSRYATDLNRKLTAEPYGSFWKSVIPNQTAFQKPLYENPLSDEQISTHLDSYYHNYHQKLKQLLEQYIATFGKVLLLDLHSFGALVENEVVLGNAKGTSCQARTFSRLSQCFIDQNFDVVENKVFTGGFIIRHYGAMENIEAIQIELHYALYLDSEALKQDAIPPWQTRYFAHSKQKLRKVFEELIKQLYNKI